MSRSSYGNPEYEPGRSGPAAPAADYPAGSRARPGDGSVPAAGGTAAAGGRHGGGTPGLARLVTGIGLCVAVLVLGVIAKIGPVSRWDLSIDRHVALDDRTATLSSAAKFFTTIGKPETVGVALMFLIPIILLLARRRLDALKAFCIFAGAFALALVGKYIINEHRPPAAIQLVRVGTSHSFPSGHATSATVIAIVLAGIVATTLAWRWVAGVIGVIYMLGVAASRVYLADHYFLDVIGSVLCALAGWYVVTGLAALPAVQPYLRRFKLL
jgi:undecaprenyl-diphosphatase